jgi:hypothetical protein
VALDARESSTDRANIGAIPVSSGCSTYGPLGFSASSTDKCAMYDSFYIKSNPENAQLGAKLVFNWVGGFYACGYSRDVGVDVQFVVCRIFTDEFSQVWYKVARDDGPAGCSAIDLYTVPVV